VPQDPLETLVQSGRMGSKDLLGHKERKATREPLALQGRPEIRDCPVRKGWQDRWQRLVQQVQLGPTDHPVQRDKADYRDSPEQPVRLAPLVRRDKLVVRGHWD